VAGTGTRDLALAGIGKLPRNDPLQMPPRVGWALRHASSDAGTNLEALRPCLCEKVLREAPPTLARIRGPPTLFGVSDLRYGES